MKQEAHDCMNIISGIKRNDMNAWKKIYEEYAAVMYGCILKITGDQSMSEKIFIDVFLSLPKITFPVEERYMSFFLWRYAGKIALAYLKNDNLPIQGNHLAENIHYPVIEMLCLHDPGINRSSKKHFIPEQQLKKKLHIAFAENIYIK